MIVYIPTKIYNKAVDQKFEIIDEQTVSYFRMKCMLTGKPIMRKAMKTLNMLIVGEESMVVYVDETDRDSLIRDGLNQEIYVRLEI